MQSNGPKQAAIRCENLTKRFGEVLALDHLDLSVPYGSIFGFLRRNGAGKTTTIRLLTGLAHPTEGSAWVGGQETTNGNHAAREQFGYLPQEPAFYGWMTPVEYLDYTARLFGLSAAARKQRIQETLALVDLKDAARRRISGFSGGMKQRLGIAQALIHQPQVLFLDEPTSALDPAGRYEVLDMIAGLRGTVTVFLSSHILVDVERICDTIAVIHKGRLIKVAGKDDLLAQYAVNAVVLEFENPVPEHIRTLVHQLSGVQWVERVQQEQNGLRILVSDVSTGKKELIPMVTDSKLVLNRYEWVRPSLEEIFLEISA